MSEEIVRKKHTGQSGNSGEFGNHIHTGDDITLEQPVNYAAQVMAFADALEEASQSPDPDAVKALRDDADPYLVADAEEMIARRALVAATTKARDSDPDEPAHTWLAEAHEADAVWRAAKNHVHELRYLTQDSLGEKTVSVNTDVRLQPINEALPPYPDGLPRADVSFGPGDEDDTLYVHFSVGEGADTVDVTVWQDSYGDWSNSIEAGAEETPWTADVNDEFLEWAHAVRTRISRDQYSVSQAAISSAESTILARATA
jgi:hypothetical protein